jgi:TRAP-type C4-dicarboxylate transport system permease small subunit
VFAKAKKALDKTLELLVTVSMGVLVVDVVWQVITRYVLKHPSSWTEELATFLMIWVGLLGASVALNRGAHLGIDYLVVKLSRQKALCVSLFVFAVITAFSLLVMVVGGAQLVHRTLVTNQVSPALGLKMGYVYLAIPISGFFLVVYSLELLFDALASLIKHRRTDGLHIFHSETLD